MSAPLDLDDIERALRGGLAALEVLRRAEQRPRLLPLKQAAAVRGISLKVARRLARTEGEKRAGRIFLAVPSPADGGAK